MNEPDVMRAMVAAKTIAVIGVSSDPAKPSNYVSRYLQEAGCRVIPVNPSLKEVLGETCYANLSDLVAAEGKPELVDVFRVPTAIPAIVDEMLMLGLGSLWVQQGIVNLDAAQKAEEGGIKVVMDRCLMVERRRSL